MKMIVIYLKYLFHYDCFSNEFFLMGGYCCVLIFRWGFLLFIWYHYLVLGQPGLLWSPVLKCWTCRHLNCKTYFWPGAQSTTSTFWRIIVSEHDTLASFSHWNLTWFSEQALGINNISTYAKFKALSKSLEKSIKNRILS